MESKWRRMMSFLWANWQSVPVMPLNNNIRIRKLVADGSKWQIIDGEFPEKPPNWNLPVQEELFNPLLL